MARKKARIGDSAYVNMVTGMGTLEAEKAAHTRAAPYARADLRELARMKVQDGIAAAIVETVPDAAFRHDVSIAGDGDGTALREATRAGLFQALRSAGEAQRLTGGALVVAEYEGDTPDSLAEPPDDGARVAGWRSYSAGSVRLDPGDFDGDEPRLFHVRRLDGTETAVSAARCVPVKGKPLPDVLSGDIGEAYFGTGFLRPCEQAVKDLASAYSSAVEMVQETGLSVFRLDSLDQMLSRPDGGLADVQRLMSTVKLGMGSMRAVYLGAGDQFEMKSHSFAGIPELIQKLAGRVSAVSRIPISVLFGQGATGLAQTNEGDTRAFADTVDAWRQNYLYRPACRLLEDFSRRNLGRELSEFEWGPVSVMTETERNDAMAKQADYLVKYMQAGVIMPEEVREAVFVNGHSFDVSVGG